MTTSLRCSGPFAGLTVATALLAAALTMAGCGPYGSTGNPTVPPSAPLAEAFGPSLASPEGSPGAHAPAPVTTPRPPASSSPTSTPTAAPRSTTEAARSAYKINLYRAGDFVAQYTFEWCVGASLQMALNMATDDERTSRADQQALWEMAQARSDSPFGGANPRGWTAALNDLGVGPYVLVSIPDYDEALRVAAAAIRSTRRPVGLVMWRGRHAWVMSGFESDADPRQHADFTVTGIRVLDPLYPHGSDRWGPSPKPNSLVTPEVLARQFVIRDSTRVNLGVPPGYLLVLPVKPSSASAGVVPDG